MLRRVLPCSLIFALPMSAAAAELRFNQTAAGSVVATGNTLGLAKQNGLNGPGIEDSIGTFITLDALSVDDSPLNLANPWPAGTTFDWTENGSTGVLTLPDDAEVLYAELVWGGSTAYGSETVLANVDDPVTLEFGGDSLLVVPDAATALDIAEVSGQGFPVNYYMRTADVTAFVAEHGAGTYSTGGVPGTQDTLINSLNAAGWTLVVAYRDSLQPIRNLTVFVGGSFVDEDATEDYSFAGFCTPPMGPFDGLALVSAIEGDADLVGDGLAIAETDAGPFVDLGGPNNPLNNFFASQINGTGGMVDTAGSFGNVNHDAFLGINAVGGRQGWDITHLPLSSAAGELTNGQTEAVLRTQTTGDSYVPTTAAFAIGVNAPDFSGRNTAVGVDPGILADNDVAEITITMTNSGLVNADDVTLVAPLPSGLELAEFTIDGNAGDAGGNPVETADLDTGVDLGTVGPDQTLEVVMSVRAAGPPDDIAAGWSVAPVWTYSYVSCVGQPPLEEPYAAVPVQIDYMEPPVGGSEGPATTSDTAADTSAGDSDSNSASGSESDASASDSDTDATGNGSISDSAGASGGAQSDDGCGCTQRSGSGLGSLALFGLALVGRRRRR